MEQREWRRLILVCGILLLMVLASCMAEFAGTSDRHAERVKAQELDSATDSQKEKVMEVAENMAETEGESTKTVVLDAGHGGMDEGTISRDGRYLEKDYTLLIVRRLREMLEARNVSVYCTRWKDRQVSKKKRIALANQKQADALISVHCNASDWDDRTAQGIEVLYSERKTKKEVISNKRLAGILLKNLCGVTDRKKRGIIVREDLYLLHHADIPACIVEVGYMSNEEDMAYIKSEEGQRAIAQGICDGIMQALEEE